MRGAGRSVHRRGRRGFTYLELTICLGLLTILMGLFVLVIERASDSYYLSCAKGALAAGCEAAVAAMEADFRETAAEMVDTEAFEEEGFSESQCAVVLASARDDDGEFHTTSDYRPDWRTVIVYCPYVTSKGVRQLRRYVSHVHGYQFPLRFRASSPITAECIYLSDARTPQPRSLEIDRAAGDPASDPSYTVYCPGITELSVTTGTTTQVAVAAEALTRKGVVLEAQDARSVRQRN